MSNESTQISPQYLEYIKRQDEIAAKLMQEQNLPYITAIIVAGDMLSAERADEMVREGMLPEEAYKFVGSYSRFDWAYRNISRPKLLNILPELWIAADPDDTNPEYLELWKEAYIANGNKTILDNYPLPANRLTIYRGQLKSSTIGISWSLNKLIAEKFARTGGGRVPVKGGIVLKRTIKSSKVLAYLTGRDEQEVIVAP